MAAFSEKTEGVSGKILALIRENNRITIPGPAEVIGVTERSVERNIDKLKNERILIRVGPTRGGHWEIEEE